MVFYTRAFYKGNEVKLYISPSPTLGKPEANNKTHNRILEAKYFRQHEGVENGLHHQVCSEAVL
jgi:hypothetical protein